MKKLALVLGLIIAALPLFAQENTWLQHLQDKVNKMEVVTEDDMPWPFEWDFECDKCYRDQDAVNVFFTAQSKYQKNPNSFAAAFNYAMVIAYKNCGEGYTLSERHYDEAYKVFEQAKKLRPNDLRVYVEQEKLLERRYFDFGDGPIQAGLVYRIKKYRSIPDMARKRLDLIKNQERLGSKKVDYLEAATICQALNRLESAQTYLNKAGHEKIKQAVEANIADIHYEFGMGISSSENYSDEDWAEFMPYTRWECKLGVIEYAEESLAVLKQYYGKYLPMSEDLGRLLMYIAEQKEEANKMRNADFTKQLQKSMAGKR